jgi:hypothetical protein
MKYTTGLIIIYLLKQNRAVCHKYHELALKAPTLSSIEKEITDYYALFFLCKAPDPLRSCLIFRTAFCVVKIN